MTSELTDRARQIQRSRENITKKSLMRRRGSVVDMKVVGNFFGVHFLPAVVVLVVLEKAEKMSFGRKQAGQVLVTLVLVSNDSGMSNRCVS